MAENGLSQQDIQDLQQVRSLLPAGDERAAKIDALIGASTPQAPMKGVVDSISSRPKGALSWLQDLEADVRYGGTSTMPGRLLKAMGAQGVNIGAQANASQTIASPVTGPIQAAQGVAEIKDHPWQGTKDIVGGTLEAATLPMAFMGGPAAKSLTEAIPSKSWASEAFAQIMSKAKNAPVDTNAAGEVALEAQKLAQSGGSMPKVIRDFLRRATDPERPPLTYEEARNFYSNATRLSADEMNRLTPVMKRQVGQFTQALGKSIAQTAEQAGQGKMYGEAMSNYRNGAKLSRAAEWMVKRGVPAGLATIIAERAITKLTR